MIDVREVAPWISIWLNDDYIWLPLRFEPGALVVCWAFYMEFLMFSSGVHWYCIGFSVGVHMVSHIIIIGLN